MNFKNYLKKSGITQKVLNLKSLSCKEIIVKIISLLLGILLSVVTFNRLIYSLYNINYRYPTEYRDGAVIDIANQFTNHINPYTVLNSLPHTYVYGFVFPFLDSIIERLASFDLVEIHHFITLICVILICSLVSVEVFKKTKSINLTLISSAIVLSYNVVTLRPEPLAIALTVLSLFIVNNDRLVDYKRVLLLSLIAIVLFYVKPYFVILFGVLMIYFVFNQSKKNLLQLFISFTFLFMVSALIIAAIFPMYFPSTVMNNLNMYNTHQISWMVKQTADFSRLNWLIVSAFILTAVVGFVRRLRLSANLNRFDKPLLSMTQTPLENIYFIYALVSIIVLTFMMGQHTGSYMEYYIQLLVIPILIFSITYGYDIAKKFRCKDVICVVFIVLFLFQYRNFLNVIKIDHSSDNQAWAQAIDYINNHDPSNAYLSPPFTAESILWGWPIYDNGQTYAFEASAIFDPRYNFLKPLFPYSQYVPARLDQWDKEIDQKLLTKQFSVIALSSEVEGLINGQYLRKNYVVKQEMDLPINLGHIEFWQPK